MVPHAALELGGFDGHVVGELAHEGVHHLVGGLLAAAVELGAGQDVVPDAGQLLRAEAQHLALDRDPHAQRLGMVDQRSADQAAQHGQHGEAALDGGRRGLVDPLAGEPQHVPRDTPDGLQRHRVLAEAGQHALDVVHEHVRRPHHQHAALLQAGTVGVEEVGGAVERHHRLARAGAAGDHGDALVRGADGLVLFGLDGGHDVAHGAAAGAAERRHQRTLAEDRQSGLGGAVEEVVLDADHAVVAAAQDPTADHVHGLGLRGAVERLGGGGAPVDDQRFVLLVAYPDAADVAGLVGGQVDAAEDQALVLGVEDGEAAGGLVGEGVALEQGGAVLLAEEVGAVRHEDLASLLSHGLRAGRGGGQVGVHLVHVRLLKGDLMVEVRARFSQLLCILWLRQTVKPTRFGGPGVTRVRAVGGGGACVSCGRPCWSAGGEM